MPDRFEFLKQQLEKNPDHAFSRYGLAMEFVSRGEFAEALGHFQLLIEKHPDHCAGYYHCGQALAKLDRKADAIAVWQRGVAACERKGDWHTKEELLAAIESAR
ncbi:MAG: hypothetical protein HYR85_16250 [Planctomycetes bacterium]|nr:hypothetical protein [Planctomycetota bacterium]MBI3845478.1 hypothetical protein [Planctomycetota bacterium]